MPPHVGIIGLGLLGSALAQRLIACGWQVSGFDVRPQCCEQLNAAGGTSAQSARELAAAAPLILLSLPDSSIVSSVVNEIVQEARGKLIVDTTTGDPQATADLGDRLAGSGVKYIDATVIGSSELARRGEVVVLAGGDVAAITEAERLIHCLAAGWFHVGPCGYGARAKLVVNLVLGLNRAVLAEGLHLAEQCALDGELMLRILQSSAAYSRVMDTKGEKMIQGNYQPEARLRQHLKDVRLILELGQRTDARLPLSEAHQRLLEQAESLGYGELDNSAIRKVYEDLRDQTMEKDRT